QVRHCARTGRESLRAGEQNAGRDHSWRADAHRVANHRSSAVRGCDRKNCAAGFGIEIEIRHPIFQHRRRTGNCLRIIVRERRGSVVDKTDDALTSILSLSERRKRSARWGGMSSKNDSKRALSIQEYANAILLPLTRLGLRILLEPGRLLVGNAGILLTRVRYIKETAEK